MALVPVFDLDGTLIDSDAALVEPFVALGVAPDEISFGHVLADECARLGISLEAYLDAYDETAARAFAGVADLVARLERWAVCSNKHARSGRAELARLGWHPEVALFSDAFAGPKRLHPVLEPWRWEPTDRLRGRHRPRPALRHRGGGPVRAGRVEPPGHGRTRRPRGRDARRGAGPAGRVSVLARPRAWRR